MDNQHRLIAGYRDLSQADIDAMNAVKEIGVTLGETIAGLAAVADYDQRWVNIAKTHFQEGLMAAVRAIAQPTTF